MDKSSESGIESKAAIEAVVRRVGHADVEYFEPLCAIEWDESPIEGRYDVRRRKSIDDGVEEFIGESGEGSGRGSSESRLREKERVSEIRETRYEIRDTRYESSEDSRIGWESILEPSS